MKRWQLYNFVIVKRTSDCIMLNSEKKRISVVKPTFFFHLIQIISYKKNIEYFQRRKIKTFYECYGDQQRQRCHHET